MLDRNRKHILTSAMGGKCNGEVPLLAIIEESIEIKSPLDKVFAYTTDAENWPIWRSMIKEAEQTSRAPWCVGTALQGVVRLMRINMKWVAKVIQYELDKNWAEDITCGFMSIAEGMTYLGLLVVKVWTKAKAIANPILSTGIPAALQKEYTILSVKVLRD